MQNGHSDYKDGISTQDTGIDLTDEIGLPRENIPYIAEIGTAFSDGFAAYCIDKEIPVSDVLFFTMDIDGQRLTVSKLDGQGNVFIIRVKRVHLREELLPGRPLLLIQRGCAGINNPGIPGYRLGCSNLLLQPPDQGLICFSGNDL